MLIIADFLHFWRLESWSGFSASYFYLDRDGYQRRLGGLAQNGAGH